MTNFELDYFIKFNFTKQQLNQYFASAAHDLEIAKSSKVAEIVFKFTFDALIKVGLTLIAKEGFKTKAVIGHHIKIIEKTAELLKDREIETYGNQMRKLRNIDFYEGGYIVTIKQSQDFLEFVKIVFKQASAFIK